MKKIGIYMVFVAAVMASCNKEQLPDLPEGNDPIYTMNGTVNGQPLDMKVGEESVIVTNGIGEKNGVMTYFGQIESISNEEKIRIDIVRQEKSRIGYDYNVFNGTEVPFMVHQKGVVHFDFGAAGSEVDILSVEDASGFFTSTKKHEVSEYGYLNRRVRVLNYSNKEYNIVIKHGFNEEQIISNFEVEGGNDSIHVQALADAVAHEWYIDDVWVGNGLVYRGPIADGVHTLKHVAHDEHGNTSTTTGLTRFMWGKIMWNMDMIYDEADEFEGYNYGSVIVSMYKDGKWYTSDYSEENIGGNLSINEIQFIPNMEGDRPLMAFDLSFDAKLTCPDEEEPINLSDISGRFLIGLTE